MLMPTSSEFIELCRSQIALLTQALGASLSVIYLTEELVESSQARLMPIAAYPDSAVALERSNRLALPAAVEALPEIDAVSQTGLTQPKQLVLPLIHEELVFGLLVTEREDRPWTTWERSQVERIASTLSLACVMDQRAQWLNQSQQQHRLRQSQQHDVLDNLLHQLKSPLTALRTFGKLLVKRLQAEDPNREIAGSILRESDRLQELLQQFDAAIDLNSVDVLAEDASLVGRPIPLLPAGVLTTSNLELLPCSVNEILLPLIETAWAIAQEKGLAIRTEIPSSLPLVSANPGALREVLSNLIDNASKYTPSGGEVHIRVDEQHDRIVIWVSDTGYGIPPEDLERLFERHYRGVQASGEIPGTGLGLAIARRLLEQMHGSIQVFSPLKSEGWIVLYDPPPQQGTSFVVELLRDETIAPSQKH
ncbi:MAG: HAMP domain-containing histidine kinase [Phormidium tanganyikae FI6-MK23]|jgi:signal transduction histidine kinase|nr:HAMP domain-containing histidine kinase [Phormidium tanganyikae FI6-MK23]